VKHKAVKAKAAKPFKAAKPSKTTKPAKSNTKTPIAPVSLFAAHQIEVSCNKQSATLLFTPHKQCGGHIRFAHEPQPSPTYQHAPQSLPSPLGSVDSDSDIEEELVEGLQHLDFHAGSDPHSDSDPDSQASTGHQSVPQSVPSSHSCSHAQPPHAGPHSKPQPCKPRGGAKDVWSFFTVVEGKCECVLCQ
jgi:hypothetical protein